MPTVPGPTFDLNSDFAAYFNVADELSDPMTTLDDLERGWVRQARKAADALSLPWPPALAAAEDAALAGGR